MLKNKNVPLTVFEIVTGVNGNVLICFNAKIILPSEITGSIDGSDLIINREKGPGIALKNIIKDDIEAIKNAETIIINRTNVNENTQSILTLH